ncbi:DUF6776 family protein [Ferrimonas gelatinilytica]|uniref:Uncharacterized protein n=1 Tax=Ferrimonas gelatinilytica TaxID=1255257 RepID=A0ABP9S7C4_9GAMM
MIQYLRHRAHALAAWERQLNPRGSVLGGLLLLALLSGAGLQRLSQWSMGQQFAELQNAQEQWQQQKLELEKQRAALELELKMEQQSQQETRALMAHQREQMNVLERELTFYRSIMAPEQTADGVFVHDLVLDETANPQRFRLRLVLTQQKVRKRFARGSVSLNIEGTLAGKPHSIPVQEESLPFGFRYFQQLESEVIFPDGFFPEELTVQIRLPSGSGQSAARGASRYPVSELISETALQRLKEKA